MQAPGFKFPEGATRGTERDTLWFSIGPCQFLDPLGWGPISPLSDHCPIAADTEHGRIVAWNVNGTALPAQGESRPNILGVKMSSRLDSAFREVRETPTFKLFGPLVPRVDRHCVATATHFFGPTMAQWSTKTRAVSQMLQGQNDPHALLLKLVDLLKSGMDMIDAAMVVAEMVYIGNSATDWQPHHQLPKKVPLNETVRFDDLEQQRANLACYFLYMATVASKCLEDFEAALRSAPEPPSQEVIVSFIKNAFLGGRVPHELADQLPSWMRDEFVGWPAMAVCLQEVPDTMRPALQEICRVQGYEMVAPVECGRPAALILVHNAHLLKLGIGDLGTHRAVGAVITGPMVLMSLHGDTNGLTETACRRLAPRCRELHMSRVCIAGDLQVAKHDAGYDGVKCDLDAYLGYEGIMAPRMVTRMVSPRSWFCPQNKNIPLRGVEPGLAKP